MTSETTTPRNGTARGVVDESESSINPRDLPDTPYWDRLAAPGPEKWPWDASDYNTGIRAKETDRIQKREIEIAALEREFEAEAMATAKAYWAAETSPPEHRPSRRRTAVLFRTLKRGLKQSQTLATTHSFREIQGEWRCNGGTWNGHGDLLDPKCERLWEQDEQEKERAGHMRHIKEEKEKVEMASLLDDVDRCHAEKAKISKRYGGEHRREECDWHAANVTARLCPEGAGVTGDGMSYADLGWPDENEGRSSEATMSESFGSFWSAGRSSGYRSSYSSPNVLLDRSYGSPVAAGMYVDGTSPGYRQASPSMPSFNLNHATEGDGACQGEACRACAAM